MAEATFAVTYGGPALEDGRMPIRDLAPALLALGDLFAEASVLVYPDRDPVALDIRATHDGSFEVDLILTTRDLWSKAVDLLSSDPAEAVANLIAFISGGASGLFPFLQWLRGRRVRAHEDRPEAGQVRLTLEGGTVIEIPAEVFKLYQSVQVRTQARSVVEPLQREGVTELTFRSEREPPVTIASEDVSAYELPEVEPVTLNEQTIDTAVSIASVAFIEGNKWRFSEGDNTYYATVGDQAFLERVRQRQEAFRSGDILRCRMRVIQSQTETGLRTEREVVEVLQHIPAGVQLLLGDEDDPPPKELGPGS